MTSITITANGVDDTAALVAHINSGAQSIELQGNFIVSAPVTLVSNQKIFGQGAGITTITAKAGCDFQYVFFGAGISNVHIRDLTVDANQVNRTSVLTTRTCPVLINDGINVHVDSCIFQNAIGAASVSGFGFAFGGVGSRCTVKNSQALNCGISTKLADGFYSSASLSLIENCFAQNCTDTPFALENTSFSGIVNCIADNCGCGAAISNASNSDSRGNFINGLTVNGWNASVTGGIEVGNPISTTLGILYDTLVCNVILYANTVGGFGNGAAINVRSTGTPKPTRVRVANCLINGATTQGILFNGCVSCSAIGNTVNQTGAAAIQFVGGTGHVAQANVIDTPAFGIIAASGATVTAQGNTCSNVSYGTYAFDTSTMNSYHNTVLTPIFAYHGHDAGATLNLQAEVVGSPMVGTVINAPVGGTQSFKEAVYGPDGNIKGYRPLWTT